MTKGFGTGKYHRAPGRREAGGPNVPGGPRQRSRTMKATLVLGALAWAALGQTAQAQDLAAGEQSFKKCLACHAVGEGAKNKVGPVLNGLDGRHSGKIEGYSY